MKKLGKIILLSALTLFFCSPTLAQTTIDPQFDPGNIISDDEVLDSNSLSLNQIQNFLNQKGSYLANYTTINAHGTAGKTAAEIIHDAAVNNYDCDGATLSDSPTEAEKQLQCRRVNTVSPKFLLVLLQKEQSLIEDSTPTQRQLDWATGYGCPDNWACNPYYQGFGKQINSAALQFKYYLDNPQKFKYQVGNVYSFANPYADDPKGTINVLMDNRATAGLYNYTPHVFNGNYNFYKLWQKYFPDGPKKIYPDGSLLQASNQAAIYLLDGGAKRLFTSMSVLASRFDKNKVISVDPEVLEQYDLGDPIKYSNYSLVKTESKKIYLLVDDKKRLITSAQVFKKIGFSSEEIILGHTADLNAYATGTPITATSTYPLGALLQSTKTGGIYFVNEGQKAPLTDKILLSTKFKGRKIIKASESELSKYSKVAPVLLSDGELLKSNNSASVYLIDNGQKRSFASGADFEALGYKWTNIITVSPQFLALYPNGSVMMSNN